MLRQIDQDFPAERAQAQMGDTCALQANASKESLVRLIRHSCQCLLRALLKVTPQLKPAIQTQLKDTALFGTADEPNLYRLSERERAARLATTVLASRACAEWVRAQLDALLGLSPEAHDSVKLWLMRLEKIWADGLQLTCAAPGLLTSVSERADKGAYRIGSATDPEATYRVHGEDKSDFGYNVQVTVSDNFVREIQADTGAQPDAVSIADVLEVQREQHEVVPPKLIYDTAAGQGKTRAQVEEATDGQTRIVAPLFPHDKRNSTFGPEHFSLSNDGTTLTCPNGQTSTIAYRSGRGDGRNFRFLPGQCQGCPLWNACRGEKAKPDSLRHVFSSDYRKQVEAARAYNQTDEFKADMKKRPAVERIIAALVRYNGAQRAVKLITPAD